MIDHFHNDLSSELGRDHSLGAGPDEQAGIILPQASKAERNVPAASSAHCTGFAVLGAGCGVRMQGESALEINCLYILNTINNIEEMREQVRFFFGWKPRKQKQHVFDIMVTLTGGERIAFAIKPEIRLVSGKFEAEMQEVAWWAYKKDFADDVRILTDADLDPVQLHNARVLAAVRDSDPEADFAARVALRNLPTGGGQSLRELTLATGIGARGHRALIRLVRMGEAHLQAYERIGPATVIMSTASSKMLGQMGVS